MKQIVPTNPHGHSQTTNNRHINVINRFDEFVAYAAAQPQPTVYPKFVDLNEKDACNKKMWEDFTGWLAE